MERFDQFFVTMAQETGGINGLFEAMFSFLQRRTDFFYESDPGDKMGFPPGVNVKIMYDIFKKYQEEHYKKFPKKDPQEYNKKLEQLNQQKQPQKEVKQEKQVQQKPEQKKEYEVIHEQKFENIKQNDKQQDNKKEKQIQQKQEEEGKKSDISTYNGGMNEKYKWAQNIQDITLQLDLPKGTKSKDLKVIIQQKFISIKYKDETLVEGELSEKIKVDESFWNIEDGCLLIMTLEKFSENIWKTVVKGDQEIDTSKVDNSKHLHEFDDETQGALRKIMYEQDRKMKGLPTTEEEKNQELLKKAWDAEGSPFKGQPFDPSKINLDLTNQQFQ